MITVPQKVDEIVKRSPFLMSLMSEGLINISSMARKMKPEIQDSLIKKVSDASIIMALKRLSMNLQYVDKKDFSKHLGDISLKSGLFESTYKNSKTLYEKIERLLNKVSKNDAVYLTFVKGVWQTTLIASKSVKDDVFRIFEDEELETYFDDLSGITVKLINEHILEPGIIAYVLDNLAWQGVNVLEVVSTFDELTVIIEDKDVETAFGLINRMKRQAGSK